MSKPRLNRTQGRKDRIELVLAQAQKAIGTDEASLSWHRLCRELESMTEPETRMPRFNGLLKAVWVAATNEQS